MPAQYIYQVSASSNVDLSAKVRAYRTVMTANAEEGSVGISGVIVDDEDASLNIVGFHQFDWRESSEGSNSRTIFRTYTAARDVSRGPFKVGRSRQWDINLADLNSILDRRIMRGADANRPAETDVARIQWVMSTVEFNLVTDSTYISTSAPTAMDANDYRNQKVLSIIDDCAQQSGKNYFLLLNEIPATPTIGLFYDFAHSTAYGSAVRLTNVLADVDSNFTVGTTQTYGVINSELSLNRDPSRVYPTVIVPYNGGDVYVNDPSISAAFTPRDTMAPAVNVHTAATARTRGLRYLADISTEEDRITMSYMVPLAAVNQLREGHSFQVKFSHLPGYTNWTTVRALTRTVEAISEEFYKVTLEATPGNDTAAAASCSTIVASMQTYDTGVQDFVNLFQPVAFTPSTASSFPSVCIVALGMRNGYEPIGHAFVTAAPYTDAYNSHPPPWDGHSQYATDLAVGYVAKSSGSPGLFSESWGGTNPTESYRGFAVYVPTSATTPVQSKAVISGGTLVFDSTPTVGNLLVLVQFAEKEYSDPAVGWTQILDGIIDTSAVNNAELGIWVRCVQTGDTATYDISGNSFNHWAFAMEWAIT